MSRGAENMLRGISQWSLAILLTGLCVIAWWARPLLPIDETRYAAVAWEMHITGDWLVPHINGEPYSHKPPLLFWLINLGWQLMGAQEWLPRLISALIALGDLVLLQMLARRLWPQQPRIAEQAAWLQLGCLTVAVFSTMLMFDLLMTLTVLIGLIGLVDAARGHSQSWALFGIGIGLGLLVKGPAVLLYLLPCALLAPWWATGLSDLSITRWSRNVALATLLGIAVGLVWALPAIYRGGADYRDMLLWGQTAGRVANAFAHARPWWWYLPLLPLLLLPWTLWPPLWRGAPAAWRNANWPERFCVAWFVPGLVAFSLASGKQVHYLIPLLPALALLGARCLSGQTPTSTAGASLSLLPFIACGLTLSAAPLLAARLHWPAWVNDLSPLAGPGLLVLSLAFLPLLKGPKASAWLATLSILFLAVLHVTVLRLAVPDYSLPQMNAHLEALDRQGVMIGFSQDYRDQYPFTARLAQPAQLVPPGQEVAWANTHPQSVLIVERKKLDDKRWQGPRLCNRMGTGTSLPGAQRV